MCERAMLGFLGVQAACRCITRKRWPAMSDRRAMTLPVPGSMRRRTARWILFYQAWSRYRIECQMDADGGDFLPP
jgi:type VI secretion system protein ImpH